ncbi:DNA topoisomerase, partial [Clostridium chrysemydis]|uniref:DNA topoisomerase n=1 Tax=Clostridium chrysemydis TaxID=2665504 RepID=UPI003F33BCFB
KSFVDNSKVSDHHAIIPTEERGNLALLSLDERRVYDLVVKRFLSHFMSAYTYVETTLEGEINGERLIAKGRVEKDKGFKKLYDKSEEEDSLEDIKNQTLPVINKGDEINVKEIEVKKNHTTPPSRFNEATLLSAMENPQKYITVDKESAKTLNQTGGLGTVATRADIIEKLFNSFVIEKKGKDIYPTSKGKQLIDLVPEDLKSPLLTAEWERRLEAISKGKEDSNMFLKEIRNYTVALVQNIKLDENKFKHDNLTGKKCPECGKYMLEVKGKQGRMYVCQDRECGHRENISRITNARCPECKKKLELRGSGEGKIYVCPGANCNFREKESVFKKRFEKNSKVNKRETNKIMQKMKKEAEADINNPFAALLKDFK